MVVESYTFLCCISLKLLCRDLLEQTLPPSSAVESGGAGQRTERPEQMKYAWASDKEEMGTSDNSIYKLRRSAEGMRSTVRSDKNMGQLTRTHIHTHTLTHIHIHIHIHSHTYSTYEWALTTCILALWVSLSVSMQVYVCWCSYLLLAWGKALGVSFSELALTLVLRCLFPISYFWHQNRALWNQICKDVCVCVCVHDACTLWMCMGENKCIYVCVFKCVPGCVWKTMLRDFRCQDSRR